MKRRKIRGPKVNHSPPPPVPTSTHHTLSHHQSHHPHVMKKLSNSDPVDQIMTSDYHRSSNNNSHPPSAYANSNAPERVNIYGVDFETGSLAAHHTTSIASHGNGSLHEREIPDFSPSNGSSALDDRRMRRTRTFIDPTSEIPRLEQWFMMTSHPSRSQIERFTEELNKLEYRRKFPRLEAKNLQFWFKNRRAKQKRLTTGSNPAHLMNGPLSTGPLSSSSSSGHNHSPPPPSSVSPVSHHHLPLSQSHHHLNHLGSSSGHALSASASNLLHHHLSHSLNNHTSGNSTNVVDLSVSSASNLISSSNHHSHHQTPVSNCTDNNNVNNNNSISNLNSKRMTALSRTPSPSDDSNSNTSASPINGPYSNASKNNGTNFNAIK